MLCKFCGAEATEVRTGHYRCNFCSNEFDDEQAARPSQSAPIFTRVVENDGALTGEQIYDMNINSVVEINATNDPKNGVMCSSGFVVSRMGLVITNAHAVLDQLGQPCKRIVVKSQKGMHEAKIVALGKPTNDSVDLCLLYVDGLNAESCTFGDSAALKNGQRVYLIGNSLGSGTCITSGIISDRERVIQNMRYPYIMTDAAANQGNSGGPLLNEHGEIIGVLVAGVDGAKGMNYAIPSRIADSFVSYVVNNSEFKSANIEELSKYTLSYTQYSDAVGVIFSGVKLLVDVIEYIVGLFKRRKNK